MAKNANWIGKSFGLAAVFALLAFGPPAAAAASPTKAQAVQAQKQIDAQLSSAAAAIKAAQSQALITSAYINGAPTPPGPVQSPDGATVTAPAGGPIYNAALQPFTITTAGQYSVSGVAAPSSASVVKLYYTRSLNRVDQQNQKGLWWTAPADLSAGVQITGPGGGPVVPPSTGPSADGSTVITVGGGPLLDKASNTWTLTAAGQYSVNGTSAGAGVVRLQYTLAVDRVDQLNDKGDWWTAPLGGVDGVQIAGPGAVIPPPPGPPDVNVPVVSIPADMISFLGKTIVPGQFNSDWNPSTWQNGYYPFNPIYAFIKGPTLVLHQEPGGSSEVQSNDSAAFTNGLYEIYASYDRDASGNIIAPLWLYANPSAVMEIDHEVAGQNGLQLRLHSPVQPAGQTYLKIIPGTYNGLHRWGIRYKAGALIQWLLDGNVIAQITPADVPAGQFPTIPLKVFMSNWAVNNVGWAGPWTPQTLNFFAYAWKFTPMN